MSDQNKCPDPQNIYLDTLALWQRNPRFLPPNDKHITLSRSERVVNCILYVHNVETTIMTFPVCDHPNTTHVASTSSHSDDGGIEVNELCNLST